MSLRVPDPSEHTRQYRRGAVMGLTVAEAFMLLAFVLLMLMMLWRQEDRKAVQAAEEFAALAPAERQAVLDTVRRLDEAGLSPLDPSVKAKFDAIVGLGNEVGPIVAAASEAERRKLEELIRGEAWRPATGEIAPETVGERVASRLQAAAAARAAVTRTLRDELGPVVARYGGTIDAQGSLVFPDTVLFDAGKADITPDLRAFLGQVCLPWFQSLERFGAAIADLRIEGHASSEWEGATAEQAYLANLTLSQARAHAVLSTCLELVPGPEGAWARSVATAVGYSSSHPVLSDGAENKDKSRRVVFRVDYSDAKVLEDIGSDVAGAIPGERAGGGKAELFDPAAP